MRRALCTSVAVLLACAGLTHAAPPTAPPPRPVVTADPDEALLRATVHSLQQSLKPGEHTLVVRAMAVRVSLDFCEKAGLFASPSATLTAREAKMFSTLLKAEAGREVICRPEINLRDGQTGFYQTGQEVEVFTASVKKLAGGRMVYPAVTRELMNVGEIFRATPKVSSDGLIRLVVETTHAEVFGTPSVIRTGDRERAAVISTGSMPWFTVETTHTPVEVRDGETAVCFGAVDENKSVLLWVVTTHLVMGSPKK